MGGVGFGEIDHGTDLASLYFFPLGFSLLHHSHFLCKTHKRINCILPPTYTPDVNISSKYQRPLGQIRRACRYQAYVIRPSLFLKTSINTKDLSAKSKTEYIFAHQTVSTSKDLLKLGKSPDDRSSESGLRTYDGLFGSNLPCPSAGRDKVQGVSRTYMRYGMEG
jgi:hypothetical protein